MRVVAGILLGLGLGVGTYLLATMAPSAPRVKRAALSIGTVKHDDMVRDARAFGALVAKDLLHLAAASEGRVEEVKVLSGARVTKGDVIVVLANPELELNVLNAESRLRESESERTKVQAQLSNEYMTQKAAAANVKAEYLQAKLQADRDEELFKEQLTSRVAREGSRVRAEALHERIAIEEERLVTLKQGHVAELAALDARIEQEHAALEFARKQVERLQVRAGADGVLTALLAKPGQQVTVGTSLAVVVNPSQLKAEVKVGDTQVKDIVVGQVAQVDTHNGVVPGRVTRIDPTVTDGTVTVDVEFDGPLPEGVRPDLSVTAVIEIERLPKVLFVERPSLASPQSSIGLFRLAPDGKSATRVTVELGKLAVATAEVRSGLNAGDQVIVSDMSQWDSHDKLSLE